MNKIESKYKRGDIITTRDWGIPIPPSAKFYYLLIEFLETGSWRYMLIIAPKDYREKLLTVDYYSFESDSWEKYKMSERE